jgi:chromosomal replication initiator protein
MTHPPSLWDGVLRRLESEIPEYALEAWIRSLVAREKDGELCLLAQSAFHGERVERSYLAPIARFAEDLAGRAVVVRVTAHPEGAAPKQVAGEAARPRPASCEAGATGRSRPPGPGQPLPQQATPGHAARGPQQSAPGHAARGPQQTAPGHPARRPPLPFTFDRFVVGPSNALAREAAVALSTGRRLGAGPLYLSSATGLGKTHLARALHTVVGPRSRGRAVYVSAEAFTTELLRSIRGGETPAFKRRFREQCDFLVVEDVQFFAAKVSTQLELFHTLEHLRAVGTPVVLTGDRLPRDIPQLDPRLRSQMASGLVAEIEPPDAALRREILRAKAASGGVGLPEESLDLLVESVRGSVRDLEGALMQVVVSASLLKRPIDLALTEAAVKKVALPEAPGGGLTLDTVVETVSVFFGVTPAQLRSRSKKRSVLVPRQLAMYLCRRFTEASLTEIGRALNRDHPSVRNAVDVVERAILERAPLRYQIEELASRLGAARP